MDISGKTKIVALLGNPVEHTLSPAMHNAAFEQMGLDYRYVAFPVEPRMLKDAVSGIRALNLAGVNVTVPHKENVIALLDDVDEEAAFIGAVNTVLNSGGKLKGFNTDGRGFMRSLKEDGIGVDGKNILIIGAGGASRAISYYLSEKAQRLLIFDIDREKSNKLGEHLAKIRNNVECTDNVKDMSDIQIIINATPLGLKPDDPLPLDMEGVSSSHIVGDLIYRETPLLREAAKKGARTINGLGMLLWQGVLAFEIWTSKTPPIGLMKEVLLKGMK